MRILFMGTPEFSVPSLKKLIDSNHEVVALVCQPDKPKGRSRKLVPPPTKLLAEKHSIPVMQPSKIKTEEFFNELKSIHPDLIAVVAYGKILPKNILDLPQHGCVNLHSSLLPKYRGAAPINWAVVRGETVTGVTTMFMDEGMDTGDILLKQEVNIDDDETAIELSQKLSEIGGDLLFETINLVETSAIKPVKQADEEATYAPIMKKEDGLIDWNRSAEEIRNLVRGMQPWPVAHTTIEGKNLKIFNADVSEGEGKPGEIVQADKESLKIATGKYLLDIKELQIEGSKRMKIEDFLRGRSLEEGLKIGK